MILEALALAAVINGTGIYARWNENYFAPENKEYIETVVENGPWQRLQASTDGTGIGNQPNNNGSMGIGISSPCHGLLALRFVWDMIANFGLQADIGIGFTGIDLRWTPQSFNNNADLYGYAGAIGISPWLYLLGTPEGANFALDLGAGAECKFKLWDAKFSVGIEGGLVFPLPPEPNTQFFRIDLNLMYRF
jgi:hypothetical protein